jgi:hypothetical protein
LPAFFALRVLFLEFSENNLDAEMLLRLDERVMPRHFSGVPMCACGEIKHIFKSVARKKKVPGKCSVIRPFAGSGVAFMQYMIEIEAINKARHPRHDSSNKKGGIPKEDTTDYHPGSL